MTVPCCLYWTPPTGDPYWICYDSTEAQCITAGGKPGIEGLKCNGGGGGCWVCEKLGSAPEGYGCCFGDAWYTDAWDATRRRIIEGNCEDCGGYLSLEEDCGVEPEPPECRYAGPDSLPEGAVNWSADLCHPVAFGISSEPGERGCAVPLSSHRLRAEDQRTGGEYAEHLAGRHVLGEDGHVYVEAETQPLRDSPESRRRMRAAYWTAELATKPGPGQFAETPGIREGYQYALALAHLPYHTVAIYRSHQQRCMGPVD